MDEELHERMRAAAAADRRSLANWVTVACERMLDDDAGKILEFLRKTAPMASHMDLTATVPGMPKTPFPELWSRLGVNGNDADYASPGANEPTR